MYCLSSFFLHTYTVIHIARKYCEFFLGKFLWNFSGVEGSLRLGTFSIRMSYEKLALWKKGLMERCP